MKAALAIVAGVLALAVAFIVVNVSTVSRQGGQIVQLQGQVAAMRAQIVSARAQIGGSHRDLITCQDISAMGLQALYSVNLANDASGNIYATPNQGNVPLPAHCINR